MDARSTLEGGPLWRLATPPWGPSFTNHSAPPCCQTAPGDRRTGVAGQDGRRVDQASDGRRPWTYIQEEVEDQTDEHDLVPRSEGSSPAPARTAGMVNTPVPTMLPMTSPVAEVKPSACAFSRFRLHREASVSADADRGAVLTSAIDPCFVSAPQCM